MNTPRTGKFIVLPRKHLDSVTGTPVHSRLGHEHDMNDAIRARLEFHDEFQRYLKSKEKKEEAKQQLHAIHLGLLILVLVPIIWGAIKIFGG